MKTRITALSLLGALAVGAPVARLAGQTTEVGGIVRASGGLAYGDGGRYFDRKLGVLSVTMDLARNRGDASGLLLGFGFSYAFNAVDRSAYAIGDFKCVVTPCVPPARATAFPNIGVGFVDLGWQRITENYRFDARFQPGVAFVSRPDIIPVSLGTGFSAARRLAGAVGVEVGTSAMYLPSFDGNRIGLRQFTIGLRSW